MTSPVIQGWCPGALRPMASGDGLVVRVRPRGGRLTAAQGAEIARLAQAHGNGLIDLSARGNVQLRGVSDASHGPLIDGLRALGLIDANAEIEGMRNIVVAPFWRAGDGTQDMAAALVSALARPDAPRLPGKFGYALDVGPAPVLRETACDIRIERDAAGGLIVLADGLTRGIATTQADMPATVLALAQWFVDAGGISGGRGRMRRLVDHVAPPAPFTAVARQDVAPLTQTPGLTEHGALVGFEFGQMQARTLAALSALGDLRVTPWRMLLVDGLADMPAIPGLITRADDPMLRVVACTGAPACVQSLQPTRDLARALAPYASTLVHVSGCAKGCAHAAVAPITLTATKDGFTLIRNGTAADQGVAIAPDTQPDLILRTP